MILKHNNYIFEWINEGTIKEYDSVIEITAPAQSDFFYSSSSAGEEGITPASLCNAPFYYTELEGDFVMRVKVSHAFKDTYDSASVMVMKDMTCWAKACFELTDFGTHAAVSVVTNGESDDANGCNIEGNTAWLQSWQCFCLSLFRGWRELLHDEIFPFAGGSNGESRPSGSGPCWQWRRSNL